MNLIMRLKNRIKVRDTALTKFLYTLAKGILTFNMPPIWYIHKPLHMVISSAINVVLFIIRTLYWKPVFIMQLRNKPRRMCFEGIGIPFRVGPLDITIGDDCRIAARIALIGRAASKETPQLIIGDNVGIGWRSGIYVGTKIIIGNNVRIAGEGKLSGYAGHPLDAKERADGKPDMDSQAKDIILEEDVWLGTGVVVNGGVTIGKGTIVGAGSVVTKDLPPSVLAGGVPARVIRKLEPEEKECETILEVVS
ncbi:MAG: acetyltransferase [Zetaproteobacteria bacterium]|nr:MAG: acetyltransferase [Zetaproteobacteria bacterium]